MRRHPWAGTVFGHPDMWVAPLQTAVSLCLNTVMPSCIYWGADFRMLYNDAWRPLYGSRHPESLGRPAHEVWGAECWAGMGEQVRQVFTSGSGLRLENHQISVERPGFQEECYFTHTACAIRHQDGTIAGVMKASTETTASIREARRARALQQVCTVMNTSSTAEEGTQRAIRALSGATADLPFAAYLERLPVSRTSLYRCAVLVNGEGMQSLLQDLPGDPQGRPVLPFTMDDNPAPAGLPSGSRILSLRPQARQIASRVLGTPVEYLLLMPLDADHHAWLLCGLSPVLPLDVSYSTFLVSIATMVSAAILRGMRRGIGAQPDAKQVIEACGLGTWSLQPGNDTLHLSPRAAELFTVPADETSAALSSGVASVMTRTLAPEVQAALLHPGERCVRLPGASNGRNGRWLRIQSGSRVNSQGRTELVGLVSDCSDSYVEQQNCSTEEKLEAVHKLAATVAHEINNPLESTTNLVYLASLDEHLAPATLQMLQQADAELARVNFMAQHTLGFYRDPVQPIRTDVQALIGELIRFFERRPDNRDIRIDGSRVHVRSLPCYPGELRQILYGILRNAAEACPSDGVIRIEARLSQHHLTGEATLRIIIADNGHGIAREHLAHVFDAFFTTHPDHSNGLGLWLSRNLVHKQHGSIRIRSRAGKRCGTCLMITLPIQVRRSFVQ